MQYQQGSQDRPCLCTMNSHLKRTDVMNLTMSVWSIDKKTQSEFDERKRIQDGCCDRPRKVLDLWNGSLANYWSKSDSQLWLTFCRKASEAIWPILALLKLENYLPVDSWSKQFHSFWASLLHYEWWCIIFPLERDSNRDY